MVALEKQPAETSLLLVDSSDDCGSSGLTNATEDLTSADSSSPCESCGEKEALVGNRVANGIVTDATRRGANKNNERVFTDPQQFFDELRELRESRRRGVLSVRCARASRCPKASEQLRQASRLRRTARWEERGHTDPETVHVRFSTLQLREYPCILGDNPGGTTGPPIAIDWEHFSELTLSVDEYESTRPERRGHVEMQMPVWYRMDLLKRCGYSRSQITELTKPVNIARAQRCRTRETLQLDPVNELLEKVARKARNVLTLGARKREERKFLEPYAIMAKLTRGERSTSPARSSTSADTTSMDFSEPESSATFHTL